MDFFEKTFEQWPTICKQFSIRERSNSDLYRFLIGGLQNWLDRLKMKIHVDWLRQAGMPQGSSQSQPEISYIGIVAEVYKGQLMQHYGTPVYLMVETSPLPEVEAYEFLEKVGRSIDTLAIKSESDTYQTTYYGTVKDQEQFVKQTKTESIFGPGGLHSKALNIRLFDTPSVDETSIYLVQLMAEVLRFSQSTDSLALYLFGKLTRQLHGDKNFLLKPKDSLFSCGSGLGDHLFLATNWLKSEAIVISVSDSDVNYRNVRDTVNKVVQDVNGFMECCQIISIGNHKYYFYILWIIKHIFPTFPGTRSARSASNVPRNALGDMYFVSIDDFDDLGLKRSVKESLKKVQVDPIPNSFELLSASGKQITHDDVLNQIILEIVKLPHPFFKIDQVQQMSLLIHSILSQFAKVELTNDGSPFKNENLIKVMMTPPITGSQSAKRPIEYTMELIGSRKVAKRRMFLIESAKMAREEARKLGTTSTFFDSENRIYMYKSKNSVWEAVIC